MADTDWKPVEPIGSFVARASGVGEALAGLVEARDNDVRLDLLREVAEAGESYRDRMDNAGHAYLLALSDVLKKYRRKETK